MARKKSDDKEAKSAIMVMMVSLNLILLILFVYLNSIGVDDGRKAKAALGSLAGTFGILPGGLQLEDGKKLRVPGAPMVSGQFSKLTIGQEFTRMISEKEFGNEASMTKEGSDLIIHVADRVLFSSGRADIHPDGVQLLQEVARLIMKFPFHVRIEGYTDNISVSTSEFPSNWELSAARSTAVLRYFAEEERMPVARMTAVGFGEHRPLVPNDRAKNRARNRRVRIVLLEAAT